MRLTKNLKAKIVERFKAGSTIAAINGWYPVGPDRIEDVIREAMIDTARVLEAISSLDQSKGEVQKTEVASGA